MQHPSSQDRAASILTTISPDAPESFGKLNPLDYIAAQIDTAVAVEREACAAFVEHLRSHTLQDTSYATRARNGGLEQAMVMIRKGQHYFQPLEFLPSICVPVSAPPPPTTEPHGPDRREDFADRVPRR